jgi:glycosyltransferase involved in cell wall biosynthesis
MSKLALCIPAWNAEPFLGRLLDSAIAQIPPFDEILVYDDASTDTTARVAASYGARVVRGEINRGPSHGKNELARASGGEWLHFHDADGMLEAGFVARARCWIADDAADVVLFGTEDRTEATGAQIGRQLWDDDALRRDPVFCAIGTTITNCGIYRRAAFLRAGGFDTDERTKYNEDQAFHLRLALAGLRFRADPFVGVIVYRREGSMSSGHPIECARAQFEVMKRAARAVGDRYAEAIGERLWHLATVCATYSDWKYVRECLTLATELRYVPGEREPLPVRALARISPLAAIGGREAFVRLFKPRLRAGVPRAS